MATQPRVRATLFDKLASGVDLEGLIDHGDSRVTKVSRETMRTYPLPRYDRFNEEALRVTVRREIAWLLNTTRLEAVVDLDPYPQVKTSVLNYGVPDLTGHASTRRLVMQRAREIRAAIRTFEPRIDEASLIVEPVEAENEAGMLYVIHGDVTTAVQPMPIKFVTEVEPDSAAVIVAD